MDILSKLNNNYQYSKNQLQWIVCAWVLGSVCEKKSTISISDGDVPEDDYDKKSIYSLLYSLYSSMGEVENELGRKYEFTFNTWGYA